MRKMKDSGIEWIGEIPKEWHTIKVGRIGEFINGYAFKPTDWGSDGLPIIRIQNLSNSLKQMNYYNGKLDDKYYVNKGDYLISWSATLDVFRWEQETGLLNQHIFKAIPNEEVVNYFYFYWIAKIFMIEMAKNKHGSAMQHVTNGIFNNFKIPLQDLPTQQCIADYLDKKCSAIDSVIKKTKVSIDEYKKIKYAIIADAVTKGIANSELKSSNIGWIGQIPTHWSIYKLKYLFSVKKDIAGELGHDVLSVTQTGLKVKDLSNNEGQVASDYRKYQLVEPKDFVMNHMDLLTGWVDCSKFNGVTSPDYRVFKIDREDLCDRAYNTYIFQLCYKHRIFYGLGQGVSNLGRWRLQTDKFINFELPLPPKEEQIEIANYLDKKCQEIDLIVEQKQTIVTELESYKKSLIYECVTGKREV